MILGIAELSIFFFFLAMLLLVNVVWSNIWWQLKAFLIVISLVFFVTSYQSIDGLLGRPTTQQIPDEFTFVASLTHAPNKMTGDPGAIYLLTKDDIGYRMYEMPYSREMKKMMRDAAKGRSKGARVKIKRKGGVAAQKSKGKPYQSGVAYKDLEGHSWKIDLGEATIHTKPRDLPSAPQNRRPMPHRNDSGPPAGPYSGRE